MTGSGPFLTDIDTRAKIRGSRDPLGLVPLWSRFGRKVVGNLTTVSDSVPGFATLLLGYYFASDVWEGEHGGKVIERFLAFEQLAAYARYSKNKDDRFRGIERVKERAGGAESVRIGSRRDCQILSSQRTYGLWGLYSVPGRDSGLIERERPNLTEAARHFVERVYLPRLTGVAPRVTEQVVSLIGRESAEVSLSGDVVKAIAKVLSARSAPEREYFTECLVRGGPGDRTHGLQPRLADLMATQLREPAFGMKQLEALVRAAGRSGDVDLEAALARIRDLERLIVPMASVFDFVLSRDGRSLDDTGAAIRRAWGKRLAFVDASAVQALQASIQEAYGDDPAAAGRYVAVAEALAGGDYGTAVGLLVEHNARVMSTRNGAAPWVRIGDRGKLDVRFREDVQQLPTIDELRDAWRSTYFLNSLRSVQVELSE
jgi:hypothetical protein